MKSGTILICTSNQKMSQELSLIFALGSFSVETLKFRAVGSLTIDDKTASDKLLDFVQRFTNENYCKNK
jgi:hypothetical protein